MTKKKTTVIPREEQLKINQAISTLSRFERYAKILKYFPDEDYIHPKDSDLNVFARDRYQKQLAFFAAGAQYDQRLLLAGNRVGKTFAASYEVTCHLTGCYPNWWTGKKFSRPSKWWVVGQTAKTTKGILQSALLGEGIDFGSGMIPRDLIDLESMTEAKKVSTPITSFRVLHKPTGEWSTVEFKSNDQGSGSFMGEAVSVWLDEEMDEDVYSECLTRITTGGNILIMTFTPLKGLTPLIMTYTNDGDYSEGDKGGGRYLVNVTWDDVPHLGENKKENLLKGTPAHLRIAKSKGIPQMGAGLCLQHPESEVFIAPFDIPPHWLRSFAIDFGWVDPTAVLWGATDPTTDILYLFAEHYATETTPEEHSKVINAVNAGNNMIIPGVCDPSGGGKNLRDGKTTRENYADFGIYFQSANNSLHPGLARVNTLLQQGKIKAFNTLTNLRREYRLYRIDKNGKFKGPDHLCDALRYLVLSGVKIAKSPEMYEEEQKSLELRPPRRTVFSRIENGWQY